MSFYNKLEISKIWIWLGCERNNRVLIAIVTILTLLSAVYIGFIQNQINTDLKNITLADRIPLLSVNFNSFKFDSSSGFFTKEVKFNNKGTVPISNIKYQIRFTENPEKLSTQNQVLDGVIYQGESATRKTVMNKIILNEPVQLIEIKASFNSLFDSVKKYCVKRTFIFQSKDESLISMDLDEFYECN
jgi:hypothetical protein